MTCRSQTVRTVPEPASQHADPVHAEQCLKATKYLAIAIAILAILAAVAWYLRDSIIQRLSGTVLSQYGLTLIDVSLDALATGNASISYLKLRHDNGATIVINEFRFPIGKAPGGIRRFTADRVSIDTSGVNDTEALDVAQSMAQVLSLPAGLPNTSVAIAEFSLPPYPTLRDVRWASTDNKQVLQARLDTVALTAEIAQTASTTFQARISAASGAATDPAQLVDIGMRQTESGFSLSGAADLMLPAAAVIARSLAQAFGGSLAGIEFASGAAGLRFDAEIPEDPSRNGTLNATLTPSGPFEFAYSPSPGVVELVKASSASPIAVKTTLPGLQWAIELRQATLVVSYGPWHEIPVSVRDLSCGNGPACGASIGVVFADADLLSASAAKFRLSASGSIRFADDGIRVLVRPDAELTLTDVSGAGLALARLDARLPAEAALRVSDAGWHVEAGDLTARMESLSPGEGIAVSTTVNLHRLVAGATSGPASVTAAFDAPPGQLHWDQLSIALPGARGDFSLQSDAVDVVMTTVGLHRDADIRVQHQLGSNTGQLTLQNAALSFRPRKLSGRVSPWPYDWDVRAGTVSGELQLKWRKPASDWQLDGRASIQLTDVAGFYAANAFTGLSTRIDAAYRSATGFSVAPARIAVGLVEIGLPIENISAECTLHPEALSVDVDQLRMTAFHGIVTADPFTFQLGRERNSLLLRAESIELTELLTLQEFEAIKLTGSVSAELPVTIEGNEVSIDGGRLTGVAPGVIRYLPEIVAGGSGTAAAGTPGIDYVTRALSNFQYETLSSRVDYSDNGDLTLQLRLAGRNPDMKDNRPIVLNLSVEDNIPQLLRSLQAARAVEEVLEKRLVK